MLQEILRTALTALPAWLGFALKLIDWRENRKNKHLDGKQEK